MMRAHKDNASYISITPCMAAMQLHSMDSVGIDTDAGRSISTNINDFIFLDTSEEAKSSISIRGIGGNGSKVGGRGVMIVKCKNKEGRFVYLLYPEGVYLERGPEEPEFRVFAQQLMKQ